MTDDENIILPLEDKKKKKRTQSRLPKGFVSGCAALALIPCMFLATCILVILTSFWPYLQEFYQGHYTEYTTHYRPSDHLLTCSVGRNQVQVTFIRWTSDSMERVTDFYNSNGNPHVASVFPSQGFDYLDISCFPSETRELKFPDYGTVIISYFSYDIPF